MGATADSQPKFAPIPTTSGYVNVAVTVAGTDLTAAAAHLADTCLTYLNDKAHIPAVRCGVYGLGAAAGGVPELGLAALKFMAERELKKIREGLKRNGLLSMRRTLPPATIHLMDLRSVSRANFLQLVELLPRFQRYIENEFQSHVISYSATSNPDLKPNSMFVIKDIDISENMMLLWDAYLKANAGKEGVSLGVRAGRWGQPEPYCSFYPSERDVQKAADASRPSRSHYPGS